MKKSILILGLAALMSSGQSLFAQVGINTDAPKTTLDIVQKDTATVKGRGFRLVDGNEAAGKVLTSNDDGEGTWTNPTRCETIPGPQFVNDYIVLAEGWEAVDISDWTFMQCGNMVTISGFVMYHGSSTMPIIQDNGQILDFWIFYIKPPYRPSTYSAFSGVGYMKEVATDFLGYSVYCIGIVRPNGLFHVENVPGTGLGHQWEGNPNSNRLIPTGNYISFRAQYMIEAPLPPQ
ncbi:MAG: hypothetical protein LBS01_00110 [Prevotellaceae bacterium]|jgi:hypothetical protein|nr:hypothetical protein [Prevotellaceae bacterium]